MLIQPSWREGRWVAPVIRILPPNPLYVDTTALIAGEGTPETPMNNLTAAMTLCAGLPDWVIKVRAPVDTPVRQELIYESTFDLVIEAWDSEWYGVGSERVTDWTLVGNGVYKAVLNWTVTSVGVVRTMSQTIGGRQFEYKLLPSTTGATTPSAGEIGYSVDTVYVRLPGDEDPNLHVMEIVRRNAVLRTRGFGTLTVRDCRGLYTLTNGITNGWPYGPEGVGNAVIENCEFSYSGSNGVGVYGYSNSTVCTNVACYRNANDGFNHHGVGGQQLLILNDCDGSYNGDIVTQSAQGASNHENTVMIINGGHYDYNVAGGMVVIDTARCDIHGDTEYGPVTMNGNMRLGNSGPSTGYGGAAWIHSSIGEVTGDVTVSNGLGVGVRVAAGATVTGADTITTTGNALPNDIN